MRQISPPELKHWLDDKTRELPVLIDVREPWEFDLCRIPGSRLVPMNTVPARLDGLDRAAETVLVCHHGARSMQVAMFLQGQGFDNLYNLAGGVARWAQQVDPGMPNY